MLATPQHIGFIDDFHALSFNRSASGKDGNEAAQLLIAAENDVTEYGKQSLMIVSPAEWHSKGDFLKANGYSPGNLWVLKDLQ